MKIKQITCIYLLLTTCIVNAGGPVLPEKWREPTSKETYQEYSKTNLQTLISGDFNGDGLVDGATIVITKDNKSQELVTFIYDNKGKVNWHVLDSEPFLGYVSMGLAKVPPGKTKVNCVTNQECASGYKKEIIIKNDSIDYFRPESANSIFIYQNGKFNRVWQSD